ncbi:MAG TPA: c-type cytochrome [Methylomirabilota bacterium]|nr:c-type cytochrome [Methylomirabilota bacterium]
MPGLVACVLVVWLGFGVGARPAAAAEAEGQAIAERWCAACHIVGPDQAAAVEGVPSFASIANARDEAAIRGFLFDPHPPMPQFNLTKRQVDDVVDYIAGLKE